MVGWWKFDEGKGKTVADSSGLENKQIARSLSITEATVKVHLRSLYSKIGARNRTQAEGTMSFRVEGDETHSELLLGLQYQLKGDLAQYSRGAVVDAVTEQLLLRFARNVGKAVVGEGFDEQAEVSGSELARAAFWQRLKRFFF